MRSEGDAVFAHLRLGGEAEDLETTTVGQQGVWPPHERADAPCLLDEIDTRAEHEMVGIGEDEAIPERFDLGWVERLDGRLSADRHEGRGFDHGIRGDHAPAPRHCPRVAAQQGVSNGGRMGHAV